MSAPHFFAASIGPGTIEIDGPDAAHARRALRIRPGESVTIGDGAGTVAVARAVEVGETFVAEVLSIRTVPPPHPRIEVYPALPKSGKLDLVVQKLTEVGVDAVRPWPAARSVVRWDGAKARAQGDRLRSIAREAAKQSKRAWLPEVADPAPVGVLPPLMLVLHEGTERRLAEVLPEDPPPAIGVLIGPEGGLVDDEVEALCARGAVAVGLGDQILRTETASIVVATLVLARYRRIG